MDRNHNQINHLLPSIQPKVQLFTFTLIVFYNLSLIGFQSIANFLLNSSEIIQDIQLQADYLTHNLLQINKHNPFVFGLLTNNQFEHL